jgi:hypothetical protein
MAVVAFAAAGVADGFFLGLYSMGDDRVRWFRIGEGICQAFGLVMMYTGIRRFQGAIDKE